ncbi:hypothetical protein Bbelb_266470 [Branchiostoma belcheri]|nr:hypothetical protein Bbelb_266470 [Branchiostoma belcheri]
MVSRRYYTWDIPVCCHAVAGTTSTSLCNVVSWRFFHAVCVTGTGEQLQLHATPARHGSADTLSLITPLFSPISRLFLPVILIRDKPPSRRPQPRCLIRRVQVAGAALGILEKQIHGQFHRRAVVNRTGTVR